MLNEKIIAIDKGRDAGKTFKVKEMPVTKLEKWAARALLAVFGAVLALATVLAISVGCAPKEADDAPKPTDQEQPSATSAMDGQPVGWTRAPGALGAPVGTGRAAL